MHLDRVATRPPSFDSSLVTPRSARRATSLVSLSPPLPLLALLTFVLILRVKGISHLSPLPIPLPRDHLHSSFLPLPLALFSFSTLQATHLRPSTLHSWLRSRFQPTVQSTHLPLSPAPVSPFIPLAPHTKLSSLTPAWLFCLLHILVRDRGTDRQSFHN